MKPTLVLGASPNPQRYSNIATLRLASYGHKVYPVGLRKGQIGDSEILIGRPELKDVDTVTLYLSEKNQIEWYDYIFGLNPKRLIFNPGAENTELSVLAQSKGIECIDACTLVMLSIGNY